MFEWGEGLPPYQIPASRDPRSCSLRCTKARTWSKLRNLEGWRTSFLKAKPGTCYYDALGRWRRHWTSTNRCARLSHRAERLRSSDGWLSLTEHRSLESVLRRHDGEKLGHTCFERSSVAPSALTGCDTAPLATVVRRRESAIADRTVFHFAPRFKCQRAHHATFRQIVELESKNPAEDRSAGPRRR